MDSYVVRKERCPECAKLGKDQSGDNLAVYSDGHVWCYSCGYGRSSDLLSRFQSRSSKSRDLDIRKHEVYLPEDCDVIYPSRALDWVKQYELTKVDLLNYNTLWSESTQRLIFPVFGDKGLLAYQGRYFGPPAPNGVKPYPKWYGKGDLVNTFNILGSRSSNKLILTEDVISAIKCSRFCMAMPLYGSHISIDRFTRLKALGHSNIYIFLDPDKRKEAMQFARRGQLLGINSRVIYADLDPKEIKYENLQKYLDI